MSASIAKIAGKSKPAATIMVTGGGRRRVYADTPQNRARRRVGLPIPRPAKSPRVIASEWYQPGDLLRRRNGVSGPSSYFQVTEARTDSSILVVRRLETQQAEATVAEASHYFTIGAPRAGTCYANRDDFAVRNWDVQVRVFAGGRLKQYIRYTSGEWEHWGLELG